MDVCVTRSTDRWRTAIEAVRNAGLIRITCCLLAMAIGALGFGVSPGQFVARQFLMVVGPNVERLTQTAMARRAVIIAQLGLKLRSVGVLMTGLALMRRIDELPRRFVALGNMALQARHGHMSTFERIDLGVPLKVKLGGSKMVLLVAIQTRGVTLLKLSIMRIFVTRCALPRCRDVLTNTGILVDGMTLGTVKRAV